MLLTKVAFNAVTSIIKIVCADVVVGDFFSNSVHRTIQQFSKIRLSSHILLTQAKCVDEEKCAFVLISILSRRRKKIPNTGNVHNRQFKLVICNYNEKKKRKKCIRWLFARARINKQHVDIKKQYIKCY